MAVVSRTVIEVRMQKGQLLKGDRNSVLHAANIPDDLTALQGPPDHACHFDKLGKRYYYTVLYILIILHLHLNL